MSAGAATPEGDGLVAYPWHWHIMQYVGADETAVAGGTAPDKASMLREMGHYAALYSEEGTIRLETRTGKNRWRRHVP
jgi:hypothetical protein